MEYKNNDIKELVSNLPNKPGVYQYFDDKGVIIYVGKAKDLKKRVSSYFVPNNQTSAKLRVLVRKICNIQHVVVDTEQDALLLENNLIKQYLPKYNVLLKDDKTYPWICIKKEQFPRVFKTRNVVRDGSLYFGPYTSGFMIKTVLDFIRQIFKLRTCSLSLTNENIQSNKFKVCLEFHIGNCLAPCVGKQDERDYEKAIEQIQDILKGNVSGVKRHLNNLMQSYAQNLEFEKAEEVRQRLDVIKTYQSKSTVVSASITNVDVFSYADTDKFALVHFLKVVDGAIIQSHHIEIKKNLDEQKEEILGIAITEIRNRVQTNSKELIVPFVPDFGAEHLKYVVPERGEKKKLLELSERNVKYLLIDKLKQNTKLNQSQSKVRILQTLKEDLRLAHLPVHIECFDNSNIQGSYPVAACVVFKEAKPSKKDYRHFNIKTVEGPNDFASMEEVVFRRYSRMLNEGTPLPQLIVIDGGKGQLGSAVAALARLNAKELPAIIGIAKRLEELFFPGDPVPLYLDKTSESLKLIQQLRDEAHRFGISFHRQKRSKDFIHSELDSISGIGPKSVEALYKKFGSISEIKSASEADISDLIGVSKATALRNHFKK